MAELQEHEVMRVAAAIHERGIYMPELSDNVLDHCCCMIEEEWQPGEPFEAVLARILGRFGETGFQEIQDETTFLLTHKNRETMKKTMSVSGLIAVIALIAGVFFKLQHWPGANILILLGFTLLSLLFIPLWFVFRFRESSGAQQKGMQVLSLVTALLLVVPGVFKLLHWPYGNVLLGFGFGVFFVLFLPLYFVTGYRNPLTRQNTISQSIMLGCCGAMMVLLAFQQPSQKYLELQKQKQEQVQTH
jgi:hypothetical protein